jgi:hypothetical protein
MSRVVRVAGRVVELYGLDQIWLGADHLANSKITLYYPKGPVVTIEYKCGEYAQSEKDKKILEEAKKDYDQSILK